MKRFLVRFLMTWLLFFLLYAFLLALWRTPGSASAQKQVARFFGVAEDCVAGQPPTLRVRCSGSWQGLEEVDLTAEVELFRGRIQTARWQLRIPLDGLCGFYTRRLAGTLQCMEVQNADGRLLARLRVADRELLLLGRLRAEGRRATWRPADQNLTNQPFHLLLRVAAGIPLPGGEARDFSVNYEKDAVVLEGVFQAPP